ncbi:MAG: ABC transporter ATP-binding protein [bacterium]
MIKILKYLTKTEWLLSLIVVVLIMFQVHLELLLPDYMSEITMLISSGSDALNEVMLAGSKMIGCAVASLILAVFVSVIAAKIASNFSARLRKEIFEKVQSFSNAEINKFSTSSLITRTTNDVTQVQILIIMGLQAMIKAPTMSIWAVSKILNKNLTWSGAVGVSVLVLLTIVGVCLFLVIPKFKKIQALTDDINRVTREHLTGLSVIRAYNAEEYQYNKFLECNNNLTSTNLFANRTLSVIMPSIQAVNSFLVLSIYFIGAYLISNANLTTVEVLFSDMIVFTSYGMQIIISFMILVMVFIMLPRSAVSAKRINEVLCTEVSIVDGKGTEGNKDKKGEIEFKNVSFKYPDGKDYILKDISFKAKKGEVIAFIGATGCGKSTIVNLIPRFFDPNKGEVLVEGINITEYKLSDLRNKIGYISQKATLFSGTIESNVSYGCNGKESEKNDLKKSIEIAQAKDFVEGLEDKYNGHIAQAGGNLSGGQKQRISIARAINRKPDIFIFDDSFSALDYKTDRNLRNALNENCSDSTRIIVAQRIGTIKNADQIIVLENGEIVGIGKHKDLLKKCEVYKEIALSQLSKEELENE